MLNPLGVMIHSIAGKVFVVLMASAVFVGVVDVVMWPWLRISEVVTQTGWWKRVPHAVSAAVVLGYFLAFAAVVY